MKTKRPPSRPVACSYAKKYKAIRAPKCGCDTCADKWKKRPAAPGRVMWGTPALSDHSIISRNHGPDLTPVLVLPLADKEALVEGVAKLSYCHLNPPRYRREYPWSRAEQGALDYHRDLARAVLRHLGVML